jgi:hypothetical protein
MKHLVLSSFAGAEPVGIVNNKFEPELQAIKCSSNWRLQGSTGPIS